MTIQCWAADNQFMSMRGYIIGTGELRLFSLSGRARLEAMLARLGVVPGVEDGDDPAADTQPVSAAPDRIIILNADCAFEEHVIAELAKRPATTVLTGDGEPYLVAAVVTEPERAQLWAQRMRAAGPEPITDAIVVTASDLVGEYNQALRKRQTPLALRVTPDNAKRIERRLYQGSYKGATDFITKFVWPEPAFHATRLAAALKIHPNLVTSLSLVLVIAAFFLFARGDFLLGAAAGWAMCFLDTVDGKLARVTLKSSKWGNVFDHGIDLVHPPFWYWAWAHGLIASGATSGLSETFIWMSFWVIAAGYLVGRLIEGYFIQRFKIEIHIWRRIDYWFRHITSRRNPNLFMLTISALAGAPALGLAAVAIWTVLSIVFHIARIGAAEIENTKAPLTSWLTE